MASTTLTDQSVATTYQGVLHAGGAAIPTIGGAPIYDGSGQRTALCVGLSGQNISVVGGIACSSQLSASGLKYPTVDSLYASYPLVSDAHKNIAFGQMDSNALIDLTPSPAGSFGSVEYITVNSKGLVTNLVGNNTTAWATFDGTDKNFSYTINNLVVTCTCIGHGLQAGQVIVIKNDSLTLFSGSFVIQSIDGIHFTFANPTAVASGSGTATIDVAVYSSFNVSSIQRLSVGVFKLTFSVPFKNFRYASTLGTQHSTTNNDIDNLQANVVSNDVYSITIRSFYVTPGNNVALYDNAIVCVHCIGNNIVGDSGSLISYDNFIYSNYPYGEPVNSGPQNLTYNITPAIMAANKWNAVIIGSWAAMNCASGFINTETTATVAGSLSASDLEWNSSGNAGAQKFSYHVLTYINNALYYGQFFYADSPWAKKIVGQYDIESSAASSAILNGLAANGIASWNPAANTVGSANSAWFTNFLTTYLSQMSPINGVTITSTFNAGRSGACYGGFVIFDEYVRFYTP